MKKLRLLSAVLAVIALALPATVAAIDYQGVGGRPANPQPSNPRTQSIFIYQLKPGQSASDGVRILNNTNQQQVVSLYGVDSVLSSGGAFACAQNSDPKHDVGTWIQLSSDTVTLAPNTNQVVPFTVTVPDNQNVGVGEHDGCIAIQAASETGKSNGKSGVLLSFRSAIRMVVTIPGKIIKRLDIKSVKVGQGQHSNYLVTPVIQNSGNVSLDTKLQVKLISLFGTVLSTSKTGTSPILPRTQASQNFELKRPFWGGFYRARVVASYNSNPGTGLGMGQGTDQQTKQQNSAIFFAVPAAAAGLIELAVLAAVVAIVYWFIRGRAHAKHVEANWKTYTAKKSDSLEKLAEEYGTSWKRIAKVNKLKPPYALSKGQKLKLPAKKKA